MSEKIILEDTMISYCWQKAELCAKRILTAHITGREVNQARECQKWLRQWLEEVCAEGYVYNGAYDEYINIKL